MIFTTNKDSTFTKAQALKYVYECAVGGANEIAVYGDAAGKDSLMNTFNSVKSLLLVMCKRFETYKRFNDIPEESGIYKMKYGNLRYHSLSKNIYYFDDGSLLETTEYYKLEDAGVVGRFGEIKKSEKSNLPNPFLENSLILELGNTYSLTNY